MTEPRGDDGRDDATDGSPHRPARVPVAAERFVRPWPDVQALESDGGLVGDSLAIRGLRQSIRRAAATSFTVLVEGESGSGKELVARALHQWGPRAARCYCAVNCAGLSDELLEAELFGHVRGAFTGAHRDRGGLFEAADGGVLFLDEVAELPPRGQATLLRVLQEGEVRRIGENRTRSVDAQVVAATNRSLMAEVRAGRFRQDLWYRLDVLLITVPPLRVRLGDLPILVDRFWGEATRRAGSRAVLAAETVRALSEYHWPGNVRELQNVLAGLAVAAPPLGRVTTQYLPPRLAAPPASAEGSLRKARLASDRRHVSEILARVGGHRGRAARALGLSRQGLAKLVKRLALT